MFQVGWFIIRDMDGYLRGALVKITLNNLPALVGMFVGMKYGQLSQQVKQFLNMIFETAVFRSYV